MAIEAFLGTRPQKAFLFTIVATAVIVFGMVATVYGKVSIMPGAAGEVGIKMQSC